MERGGGGGAEIIKNGTHAYMRAMRERERELYWEPRSITGGLGRRPQHGLRITTRYPVSPPTWWGSILHGEDFPRIVMRGSPACAVEPVRHRQETLDLAAWRD
jgi:hypothetical protein